MISKIRIWIAGVTLVAAISLVFLSGPSYAGGEKDLRASVQKIADAIKKGNREEAKKLAAAVAKDKDLVDEIGAVMHMFRPRNKGGMGVGNTPLANPAKDGIEAMLRDYGRDVPATVAKQAEALEATGYWIAALAELADAKGPEAFNAKKTKKAWNDLNDEMYKNGINFAKAANGKGAQQIKSAAAKVNETCSRCHSVFKEN
jgi:hypothetical protein